MNYCILDSFVKKKNSNSRWVNKKKFRIRIRKQLTTKFRKSELKIKIIDLTQQFLDDSEQENHVDDSGEYY